MSELMPTEAVEPEAIAALNPETPDIPEATASASPDPETPESEQDEEKKKKKKPGLGPRWSYIITRGLVVGMVWAFFTYAFDPILRQGAIVAGQQAAGAKVDLESLTTGFFPPRVVVSNVAVANADAPDTNLVEFAELRGNVSGMALMRGSYVIDEATVAGLSWNTQRAESGKLDDVSEEEAAEEPDEGESKLGELGKQWADDLFGRAKLEYDPRNLETVRLADQLEDEWKRDFDDLEVRAKNIETQYKQLKDLIKAAKGGNPLKKLEQYRRVAENGERLLGQVRTTHNDLQGLIPKANKDVQALDAARERDQIRIRQKIQNLTLNGDELSEFLLGPTLHNRLDQALSWIRWADDRAEVFSSGPKPQRSRGEDILFPIPNEHPKYLVRLINVSGQGEVGGQDLAIEGTISNVTSDPKKLGKPTVVRMSGRGEADVEMKAVLDRTGEQRINDLDLESLLSSTTEMKLGDNDSLIIEARAESTRWHVQLKTVGDQLQGRIILSQQPATLTPRLPEKADDALQRIVAASMQNIDRIEATVDLSGTIRKPRLDLSTNLGPIISEGIQRGLGQEISAQSDVLVAKFNADFSERRGSLTKMFNGRFAGLDTLLRKDASELQNLIPKIGGNTFNPSTIFR